MWCSYKPLTKLCVNCVFMIQVWAMGWDWKKLDITGPDKVNLSIVLLKGKYILDGTLNQTWYKSGEYCVNGPAQRTPARKLILDSNRKPIPIGPGPEAEPSQWRHATAVDNGMVREYTCEGVDAFRVKWLYLGVDGVSPQPNGYFKNILRVYQLTRKE